MKNLLLTLALLLSVVATSQNESSDRLIDSLEVVVARTEGVNGKQSAYRNIFETYKLSQFDVAFWAAQKGLQIVPSSDVEQRAFFSEALGYAYQKRFIMDSALVHYLDAIDLNKQLDHPSEVARIMDAVARIHRKLQNHEKALWYYAEALTTYENLNDDEGRARILNERGAVYENMGESDLALQSYQQSLEIQLARNDSVGIGYALEFIGYHYLQRDSLDLSEDYLLRALNYRENMKDEFALMLNEYALGELYNKTGDYAASDVHINRCFALSEKLSFVDIRQYALDIAISNRKAQGQFQQALELLEQRTALNDSLAKVANQARVDELSEKFRSVEQENRLLIQKAKLERQNYAIYALTISSVLILLIAVLAYRQQRLQNAQRLQKAELKLARSTIESQIKLQQLREEISRDLHDNIGTQLTFIISSIDTIKHRPADLSESALNNRLDRISEFTRETISELRDTIWAMNSASINLTDLQDRIGTFIERANFASPSNLFDFINETHFEDDLVFDSRAGMNVYRFIQEGVHNAIKHANATKIQVRFEGSQDELKISIRDNGVGIESNTNAGNGTNSMKKRADDLGGTLTVHTGQLGTELQLILPKPTL